MLLKKSGLTVTQRGTLAVYPLPLSPSIAFAHSAYRSHQTLFFDRVIPPEDRCKVMRLFVFVEQKLFCVAKQGISSFNTAERTIQRARRSNKVCIFHRQLIFSHNRNPMGKNSDLFALVSDFHPSVLDEATSGKVDETKSASVCLFSLSS